MSDILKLFLVVSLTAIFAAITAFCIKKLFNNQPPVVESGNYQSFYQHASKPIVLFGDSRCPFCQKTEALLNSHNIDFQYYLVDQDEKALSLYKQLDSQMVPVLLIGNSRVNGYVRDEILNLLQQNRFIAN